MFQSASWSPNRKPGWPSQVHLSAGASNLARLTWLHMDNNGLTDAGAQAILDSPYLRSLTDELGLDDEGISDEMVRRLRKRFKGVLYFYRPSVPDEDR